MTSDEMGGNEGPAMIRHAIATFARKFALVVALILPVVANADGEALTPLTSGDSVRGWKAVGRLNLGPDTFCTGVLIAEDLVLTAAHCMFDPHGGQLFSLEEIEFRAGWRNGRAEAYRKVKGFAVHPDYDPSAGESLERVAVDLALIALDHPIRLPSVQPFDIGMDPKWRNPLEVVSYAHDRAEVPSLQEVCHAVRVEPPVIVIDCAADYGASGAPVFQRGPTGLEIVAIVAAKAEVEGKIMVLGTPLGPQLAPLQAELEAGADASMQMLSGSTGGAKFLSPAEQP